MAVSDAHQLVVLTITAILIVSLVAVLWPIAHSLHFMWCSCISCPSSSSSSSHSIINNRSRSRSRQSSRSSPTSIDLSFASRLFATLSLLCFLSNMADHAYLRLLTNFSISRPRCIVHVYIFGSSFAMGKCFMNSFMILRASQLFSNTPSLQSSSVCVNGLLLLMNIGSLFFSVSWPYFWSQESLTDSSLYGENGCDISVNTPDIALDLMFEKVWAAILDLITLWMMVGKLMLFSSRQLSQVTRDYNRSVFRREHKHNHKHHQQQQDVNNDRLRYNAPLTPNNTSNVNVNVNQSNNNNNIQECESDSDSDSDSEHDDHHHHHHQYEQSLVSAAGNHNEPSTSAYTSASTSMTDNAIGEYTSVVIAHPPPANNIRSSSLSITRNSMVSD